MRSRNIKPGFFKNEHLIECSPLVRLVFAGLWCLADNRGRLEDRPRKIQIELLPCDECDMEGILTQLHHFGFINRYEVKGERYIQVVKFDKHQHPHHKEKDSLLPAAGTPGDPKPEAIPVNARGKPRESSVLAPKKVGASLRLSQEEQRSNPVDSLIPDSLIPESSLTSDSRDRALNHPKHHSPQIALTKLSFELLPTDWSEWVRNEMGWSTDTMQDVWTNFRDYWQSRTGKSAQKYDWGATWRNWCRQQNIRNNGAKHAANLANSFQSPRPNKSERVRAAILESAVALGYATDGG